MEKVTVQQIREILENILVASDEKYLTKLAQINDEELLKTNIQKEFNLDFSSLDCLAMEIELHRIYGVKLEDKKYAQFNYEPTVENLINLFNDYGQDE